MVSEDLTVFNYYSSFVFESLVYSNKNHTHYFFDRYRGMAYTGNQLILSAELRYKCLLSVYFGG